MLLGKQSVIHLGAKITNTKQQRYKCVPWTLHHSAGKKSAAIMQQATASSSGKMKFTTIIQNSWLLLILRVEETQAVVALSALL